MVSGRTLLAAGIAIIAIVSLASIVVIQQMALQNISRQSAYVHSTYIIPPVGRPSSTTSNYVLIRYYGLRLLCSGETFLSVSITVENHGYDHVNVSVNDFYVVIGNQQFQYSPKTYSCITTGPNGALEPMRVFNGLSVQGWLLYEVPTPTQTATSTSTGPIPVTGFSLFWDHPSDVNVEYSQY